MANNNIATALLILALASPAAVYAADHVVGGPSAGWTNFGTNYNTWAAGETFVVGDNLVFNYDSITHSVAEVLETDYTSCSLSNLLKTYSDGTSTIPLTGAGNRYFICPTGGHCGSGMKLSIKVVAASSGTPPTTPTTPTTPATPTTPTTPTAPSGSGSTTPPATTNPAPPSNSNSPSGAPSLFPNLNNLVLPSVMLLLEATVAAMG